MGLTVLSTTRSEARVDFLRQIGIDHPIVDDGLIAQKVRAIIPDGVDAALELVGTPTLPDTLNATRVHGTVCFTGMLSNQWTVENFYPNAYIPNGVRLTAYGGDSSNLPPEVLQRVINEISSGRLTIPIHTYSFDQIQQAHADMENNQHTGKQVVRVNH